MLIRLTLLCSSSSSNYRANRLNRFREVCTGGYCGVCEGNTEHSMRPTAPVVHGSGSCSSAPIANHQPMLLRKIEHYYWS